MKKARILFYTYRKSGKVAYGLRKTKSASILDAQHKKKSRASGFFFLYFPLDFAVHIINLVKQLKEQRENIMSNQIGRSGMSIGANIREAKYAHGTADFISKMQIALKEAIKSHFFGGLFLKQIRGNS